MSPECQHYSPANKEYPRVGPFHLWVPISHPPFLRLFLASEILQTLSRAWSMSPLPRLQLANSEFMFRPLISSHFPQWFFLHLRELLLLSAPQRLRHLSVTVFTAFYCCRLLSWLCSPLDQKLNEDRTCYYLLPVPTTGSGHKYVFDKSLLN